MTLTESISRQLDELNFVPLGCSKYLHHLYADYVELLALFSNGDYITPVNLISRLSGEGVSVADDIEEGTGEEIGSLNTQTSDSEEAWSDDIFSIVLDRSFLFGDKYPFEVEEGRIVLKRNLQTIQSIYLMLLLASSLKYFKILQPRLTSEFEEISFLALKNYLPSHANVKQFGKQSDYTGSAINKIKQLAEDMGMTVDEDELADVSSRNNQEEGLDLVGWIPFDDGIPSMLSIFGQCACGDEWHSKQHETRRYEEFFKFYKVLPIHGLFIPYSLGRINKRFFQSKEINKGSLVFDRRRILDHLDDTTFFSGLDSYQMVQSFIEYEEDLV